MDALSTSFRDLLGRQDAALRTEIERATAAEVELRTVLDTLSRSFDEGIQAEETRAKVAEAQIVDSLEAMLSHEKEDSRTKEDRARAVEGEMRSVIDDLRRHLEQTLREQDDRANKAISELRGLVDAIPSQQDAKVSSEEERAERVETELRGLLGSVSDRCLDALRVEEDRAKCAESELRRLLDALPSKQMEALRVEEVRALAAEVELRGLVETACGQQAEMLRLEEERSREADENLRQLIQQQKEQAIAGSGTVHTNLETKLDSSLTAIREESIRATSGWHERLDALQANATLAQSALQDQLSTAKDESNRLFAERQVAIRELQRELEALRRDHIHAAEQMVSKESVASDVAAQETDRWQAVVAELSRRLEAMESACTELRDAQERHFADVRPRMDVAEGRLKEQSEAHAEHERQSSNLSQRLEVAETRGKEHGELYDKRFSEQARHILEIGKRQDATIGDIETICGRIDELTVHGDENQQNSFDLAEIREQINGLLVESEQGRDAGNEALRDLVGQMRGDLEALREDCAKMHIGQSEANETREKLQADALTRNAGFEEQLGAMIQTVAELMGRLDECATRKAVFQLRARVDGALDSIVLRLETQRWVSENINGVADGITNSFLHLMDQSSEKLQGRVKTCEAALFEGG
eukprot:TRINITY_DN18261_c0_g1_i1.p1 TRINITY_DN18261_c0_g1~~TRINITY_DN18261_c0_g1_i1.p1  ORF type:complete len:705 (-),score=190.02 TRINITY_DN18261_c0_g1_i1:35-1984(-)